MHNYTWSTVSVFGSSLSSGVSRGLSQAGQNLAEGGPLVTIKGPLANSQKNVGK